MRNRVSREILQEYERLREKAQVELQHRTEEVYRRLPRIAEIDRQMSQVGMDIARWVLRHPEDIEKGTQEIRATLDKLKKERSALLAAQGLDDRFLELAFSCQSCRDTGYTPDNNPCRCLRQKLIERAYQDSNLELLLRDQHFGTFDLQLFSDVSVPGKEKSPRENIRQIQAVTRRFIDQFESYGEPNLIFLGDTGLGKTFLCSCVARSLLDKGYTVLYQTSFRIAEAMENYKFGRRENPEAEQAYRMIYDCDLLIVDDLGTELANAFTNVEFFNILNSRLMNKKKMIFSTNLSATEMARTYGERVFSRLISQFELLEFYGKDLRWQ